MASAPPDAITPLAPNTSYLPPKADPLIGQLLAGRYLIHKKLGEGGMGAVYQATHNVLEKQVALKVLHGEFARKPDLVERFMQEAKAASRIRHENVIDISDFGSTPEGLVFFAMELLKGHDLHEEIARARLAGQLLPWERSKRIFLQVCAALGAAHAMGIIHRDLKPENIYLVEFLGEPDFVKLLDFGIAKLTEVSDGDRKLTRTGMLFGTPEYMSPEQARGEQIDHRVDVYAMGCILFQMVTGRVPFEADNFMSVLSLHLVEPAPVIPPEVFDSIGAPRALAAVIDQALAKDRNQRFGSIDDLARAVRRASGDRGTGPVPVRASVPAPPSATMGRVRTQWTGHPSVPEVDAAPPRKSKLPLILGAVVLAGGAAAAGVLATRSGAETGSQVAATTGIVTGTPATGTPTTGTPTTGTPATGTPATGTGTGTPASTATPATGAATLPPPAHPNRPVTAQVTAPPPPAAPARPDPSLGFETSELRIDSIPHGAEVRDPTTDKLLGYTPHVITVPASRSPVSFALRLKDHFRGTATLVPNRPKVEHTERLGAMQSDSAPSTTPPPVVPPDCDEPPCLKPDPSRMPGGSAVPPGERP